MKQIYVLLIIGIAFIQTVFGQQQPLSPVERAYLFHIVKKSPILNDHIGRYFEYRGDEVKFANGNLNYDSIESVIINNPDMLIIREQEIAKSAKGILAEAANKTAIWELNKMLLAKRTKDPVFNTYENRYARFEAILMKHMPPSVLNEDRTAPHPRLDNVLNPGLSLDDKVAQLGSFRGMTDQDELLVIQGISTTINEYIEQRTKEIFTYLGGEYTTFVNVLTAAGDGSLTSGLLDEREKDEKGRWNRGLPKAIGLFPYQVYLTQPTTKKEEPKVEPMRYTITDLTTVGENRATNLHFDVWGYNASKQTTVVIEKNGKSYHLFGSGETRFLSPDSTFSSGTTFQSLINELEFVKIAGLTEKISGKRGYEYWIEYYTQKKKETELKIVKAEKSYSDLGYKPITTSDKPSGKVKKAKKRAIKAGVGADNWDAEPTTYSGKKQKGSGQHTIVSLYQQFDWYKAKIKELEKEKLEAIDLRARYQLKLDGYKQLMGYNWVSHTEKDGLYLFADSATFDMYTQEFQFPASDKSEDFEVRLIAIPESVLSNQADEVMLHLSLIDSKPNYNARLQLQLVDQFESDKYELKGNLLDEKDSISLRQFFEAMLDKEKEFSIIARGQGIGKWNGVQVTKDIAVAEQITYGSAGKEDEAFKRLRFSEVMINIERGIMMEVNSYTDPVKSNFSSPNPAISALKNQYKLSNNDLLSAYRSAAILKKFKEEMSVLAGTYMTREEAKIIIDRFNRQFEKTKITVGHGSIKIAEF
ncbi:hypothetical protein H9Y05_00680 [Crocinitomicaceae bacterium CZZ-1]|uniref:Uncharacterized protein n=1 Tax=Taishania pollutisoli TaxID=2766479 RepID=A0A8J6PGP3_9FLAO|nr:hypothetical protein [Taishania pollutisoli]MBC9810979.1 hypothetical protein [Taishania pollutisoli]MBX2950136.1 hypothetical protein [Crocinitomicaceae bacterium]